jgi:hypothetical protein
MHASGHSSFYDIMADASSDAEVETEVTFPVTELIAGFGGSIVGMSIRLAQRALSKMVEMLQSQETDDNRSTLFRCPFGSLRDSANTTCSASMAGKRMLFQYWAKLCSPSNLRMTLEPVLRFRR